MKKILCFALAALISLFAFLLGVRMHDLSPKRDDVDVVVFSFIESKSEIEAALQHDDAAKRALIVERARRNRAIGSFHMTSAAVFIADKNYSFAVLIERENSEQLTWRCTVFPAVSYESLCSRINRR